MKHLCLIHFEYTHYVGRTKVVESCRLLEKHIKKYCAGHGQLLNYYNDYEDYVESTLWTEEDDIKDVLNAMMQNLPDGVMREGLKGYFSYTGPTLKDLLGVITKKFDYEKKQPQEQMSQKKPSLSSSRKFIKDLQLELAHKASFRNREQIERSKQCGCFFCGRIFPASKVTDYVSREEPTALCPYCYTDSVLGDASGYPITVEFLKEMNKRWF